jgi:hypothetical protein
MEEKKNDDSVDDDLPLPMPVRGEVELPVSVATAGPSISFALGTSTGSKMAGSGSSSLPKLAEEADGDEDLPVPTPAVRSGPTLASLIANEGGYNTTVKKSSRSLMRKEHKMAPAPATGGFTSVAVDEQVPNQQVYADISNARIISKKAPVGRELTQRFIKRNNSAFKPKRYKDIETDETFIATTQKFLDPRRYLLLDEDGQVELTETDHVIGGGITAMDGQSLSIDNLKSYNEVELLGHVWRKVLQWLIQIAQDPVNALRITRGMQFSLPFLSAYEAYVLSEVIAAFDEGSNEALSKALIIAFKCRNVSRIVVQQMARFDIFWHQNHQFKYARWYDGFGRVAIIGRTGFPTTENFANTRDHAIGSLFRRVLGEGTWWTRVLTGRQALQTDDEKVVAQNLAAELSGFEAANRNQYGTFIGREKTNAFRLCHRLPTDESIVRSFVTSPLSTMVNNGVEHVLWQLAKHWHNMLYQPFGNFAHQRMEQLNPFEMLRFHMPVICVVLSTLRGLGGWDSEVLAPFVVKLQLITNIEDVSTVKELIQEMRDTIVLELCGGVASRIDLLRSFLDAIFDALTEIGKEAELVNDIAETVEAAVTIGMDLITSSTWAVPNDAELLKAVHAVCENEHSFTGAGYELAVSPHCVRKALGLLAPKDMRTLIELVSGGYRNSAPAVLLARRTVTLLQREVRRDAIDATIRDVSKGPPVAKEDYIQGTAYWLLDNMGTSGVYVYDGKLTGIGTYRFHGVATQQQRNVTPVEQLEVLQYIEIAEIITRAQHAFMQIELDFQKKFSYDAFMEFEFLREPLRRLQVLAILQCSELDDARMNVLQTIKSGFKTDVAVKDMKKGNTYYTLTELKVYEPLTPTKDYSDGDAQFDNARGRKNVTCPPQNLIVIGGGPTGLLTALHCLENVLLSQGGVTLFESRDAFGQAGATFERSQIVRLDSRWIAMLRYHLGTLYEDEWVPLAGETDPHYGNTLPTQGFIEITIKDMESLMNLQISKLASRHLIRHDTNAGCQYDVEQNQLAKLGSALKVGDLIKRKYDPSGVRSEKEYTWEVEELLYSKPLTAEDLCLGGFYGVFDVMQRKIGQYELVGVHTKRSEYVFEAVDGTHDDIICSAAELPPIFPKGTKVKDDCESIRVKSILRDPKDGGTAEEILKYSKICKESFLLDVGHSHVAEAIGKPRASNVHFEITTEEPYGVACLSGLKVSMGMHNFGTRRWQSDIVDDFRSHTDQNTRVIGDFTKTVNSELIVKKMVEFVKNDPDWKLNLEKIASDFDFKSELSDIHFLVVAHSEVLYARRPYVRTHLQTRFFETGDNFYLGMEFTREYDIWKKDVVTSLMAPVESNNTAIPKVKDARKLDRLKFTLTHYIDRLWYDATLEAIRQGDVYNPGGQSRVPRLYFLDSQFDRPLGDLPVGECFRLSDAPEGRYEVLIKSFGDVVIRDVEGRIMKKSPKTLVRRGNNLTRKPDGNGESAVAIATFPVGHYVNHRTMRLNGNTRGYVFCFCGDEQSTPHFMRYSGLTGAAVNAMLLNNFIGGALETIPFIDRYRQYTQETTWSNGEVVTRGTGANYGEDGFLAPGFKYSKGLDYLAARVVEFTETGQDLSSIMARNWNSNPVLSRDWMIKFAAALVPRGMEYNADYINAMKDKVEEAIFVQLITKAEKDKYVTEENIGAILKARAAAMAENGRDTDDPEAHWAEFISDLQISESSKEFLSEHVFVAKRLEITINQCVELAQKQYQNNLRISSQMENQPKSTDAIIDDFAVEAQNFTNSVTQVASLSALSLALQFVTPVGSAVTSAITAWIAVGTITNVSRYKNRNEEFRKNFADKRYVHLMKQVYGCLGKEDRLKLCNTKNPFFKLLEAHKAKFLFDIHYYNYPKATLFLSSYEAMIELLHKPEAIKRFMAVLTTQLMADIYQVCMYLKDDLVKLYQTCEEMLAVEEQSGVVTMQVSTAALGLLERLVLFVPKLETSLQRGEIKTGAFRESKFKHGHLAGAFQYVYTSLHNANTRATGCCTLPRNVMESVAAASSWKKPVAIETLELYAQMKALAVILPISKYALSREVMDLQSVYFASRESYVSSVVIISSTLSLLTGVVFTIANIALAIDQGQVWAQRLILGSSFSFGIITPISSVLSFFFLMRKIRHIISCDQAMRRKIKQTMDPKGLVNLKNVQGVAHVQEFVNLTRGIASLGSAVALPFALASSQGLFDDRRYPLLIALCSVALQIISVLMQFLVEYVVLWHLDPKLGEYVCVAFEDEIQQLKHDVQIPTNEIQAQQVQERAAWEYVARGFLHRYRFDTIFAANRFGNVFQYILSGQNRRSVDAYAITGRPDQA